jgi:hypothetical protein
MLRLSIPSDSANLCNGDYEPTSGTVNGHTVYQKTDGTNSCQSSSSDCRVVYYSDFNVNPGRWVCNRVITSNADLDTYFGYVPMQGGEVAGSNSESWWVAVNGENVSCRRLAQIVGQLPVVLISWLISKPNTAVCVCR